MEQKNQNNKITQQVQQVQQESKPVSMDKSTLLIIVLLFMFSSKLWDIAWDIGKSILYIIIIMYLIGFVNQDLSNKIKEIINDFTNVNTSSNFISDLFSKLSFNMMDLLNIKKEQLPQLINQVQPNIPSNQETKPSNQETKPSNQETKSPTVENFNTNAHANLIQYNSAIEGSNTKNLSNLQKNDNKNIYF